MMAFRKKFQVFVIVCKLIIVAKQMSYTLVISSKSSMDLSLKSCPTLNNLVTDASFQRNPRINVLLRSIAPYNKLELNGLVCLILSVPVNNFSVMLGRSHRFLGITSTSGE